MVTGAVLSNIIVPVICAHVLYNQSIQYIYIVFIPSPRYVERVRPIEPLHVCRFVGRDPLPKATCSPPAHVSVAHVVVNVTFAPLVYVAPELTINDHHTGGVIS